LEYIDNQGRPGPPPNQALISIKENRVKKEVNDFIRQVVIDLLAALLTSSVIFSGSSRLITGYWMRWFRTPFIYLWAVVAVLVLAWIIRRRSQRKKDKVSDA
jgi:protein-S-isoprenylcysteine O-methyltransferase Ste14